MKNRSATAGDVPLDWPQPLRWLEKLADVDTIPDGTALWRAGQDNSLRWIARQLRHHPGVLVADEVGLGKTRLAVALAVCVAAAGGRVAVLIPPGLAFQWQDEELPRFLDQLRLLRPSWLKEQPPEVRFLRTYADLFKEGGAYPLAQRGTVLFISHGFGLPPVGKVKRDELWALPYLAKKAAGHSSWGSGGLEISKMQRAAAQYAGTRCGPVVQERMRQLVSGRPSPGAFKEAPLATLFENLIGTLIGDVDLIVIDEAHKARAGSDVTLAEKRRQTQLSSRLTRLIDHILLRPGCAASAIKRLALTATPMELGTKQWRSIFSRLGLEASEVQRLGDVVEEFACAVQGLVSGSTDELRQLMRCAAAYQSALQPIVTRRLWRDHPVVQRYAEVAGRDRSSHPHRDHVVWSVNPANLCKEERQRLALAEALSAAARGADVAHDAKTAGMRFSQALPPMSEAPQAVPGQVLQAAGKKRLPASAGVGSQVDKAREARAQRCAFWKEAITEADKAHLGEAAREARWALQWHPRVRSAVELIETLTRDGEKVLVFGEFLASLHALDRALNIRHYLRHMRQGKAIPLPQGVRASDPDIQRWLQDPAFRIVGTTPNSFEKLAGDFTATYERERAHLRAACQRVLVEQRINRALSAEQARVLTTWLVQQLCVAEPLWRQDDEAGIQAEVRERLKSLRDPDPPKVVRTADGVDDDAEEDDAPPVSLAWPAIVEQLKDDLQLNEGTGEYVFRMSPFAQLMIGDTKPATRRARQGTFNHSLLHPRVLLGQSDVMSEGLNLHRACRTVVLFHLDWNPGKIEQQIGRVDRQDSAWMRRCEEALDKHRQRPGDGLPLPTLSVYALAVQGTYDDLRTRVVEERARLLRAQLYGEVVPAEQLAKLPGEAQEVIAGVSIDFRPPAGRGLA